LLRTAREKVALREAKHRLTGAGAHSSSSSRWASSIFKPSSQWFTSRRGLQLSLPCRFSGATTEEKLTIPLLSGGARAVTPWCGLSIREWTHPGATVRASLVAFTPFEEGNCQKRPGASGNDFIAAPRTGLGALCELASARLPRHLPIVLLILLSSLTPASASGGAYSATVRVFSLFHPICIEMETQQETIVSIQNGAIETRRVLVEGQRLQVERLGERLKVRFFERHGRLLHTNQAESVRTQESACILSVPGRIQRTFFGSVEVVLRRGLLLPRITVQEEFAVQQILRSEMAGGQQPEALKAQAILVRTYFRTSTGRHQKDGYDFCDTTHCQFFTGFMTADNRFRQAAMATRGLVLTFLGKSFQPLYTAACGGRTLSEFADRNGPAHGSGYPYRAVSCSFCAGHPLFEWETTVDTQALLRALKQASRADPSETLARLTEPGEAGTLGALKQATRISAGRVLGWNIVRSNRYSVEIGSNSVKIRGHGSGHNFGLCQVGAIEMSRQGKTMMEILSFYFPACRIARESSPGPVGDERPDDEACSLEVAISGAGAEAV